MCVRVSCKCSSSREPRRLGAHQLEIGLFLPCSVSPANAGVTCSSRSRDGKGSPRTWWQGLATREGTSVLGHMQDGANQSWLACRAPKCVGEGTCFWALCNVNIGLGRLGPMGNHRILRDANLDWTDLVIVGRKALTKTPSPMFVTVSPNARACIWYCKPVFFMFRQVHGTRLAL